VGKNHKWSMKHYDKFMFNQNQLIMRNLFALFLCLLATSLCVSQVTVTTQQVYVNNQTMVNECGTINFGTTLNNNLVVYFKLSKSGGGTNGTLHVMLQNSLRVHQVPLQVFLSNQCLGPQMEPIQLLNKISVQPFTTLR
jgi:hypothetical protein